MDIFDKLFGKKTKVADKKAADAHAHKHHPDDGHKH